MLCCAVRWVQTEGSASVYVDKGKTHASKDFFDAKTNRRILWIWGTVPSGVQAVPRELSFHPGTKQIVYAPVDEMRQLRTGQLGKLPATSLLPGSSVALKAGAAADIELFFDVPTDPTNLTVGIGSGQLFLTFLPLPVPAKGVWPMAVGFRSGPPGHGWHSYSKNDTFNTTQEWWVRDGYLPAGDDWIAARNVTLDEAQALCASDGVCAGFTFHDDDRTPAPSQQLKCSFKLAASGFTPDAPVGKVRSADQL